MRKTQIQKRQYTFPGIEHKRICLETYVVFSLVSTHVLTVPNQADRNEAERRLPQVKPQQINVWGYCLFDYTVGGYVCHTDLQGL